MNQTGEGHAEKTVGNTIESPRDQPRKTGRQSKRLRASRGSKRLFVHSSWVYRCLHAHSWVIGFGEDFARLILLRTRRLSPASHADILKPHGTQAYGVEQILGVHDDWVFEEMLDAVEVERAKLRPARSYNQRIHALRRRIR